MSLKRFDARRDKNEQQIVDALRQAGAKVLRLDVVDLAVHFRGQVYLLEVKTTTGKLTPAQKALLADGWPIAVVRTPDAALAVIGADND